MVLLGLAATAVAACSSRPAGETGNYAPETYGGEDAAPLDCVPDLDGEIEAEELEAELDVEAKYLVSPPGQTREVDLEGEDLTGGGHRWDWSEERKGDRSVGIAARELEQRWYADSFPNGEFVLPVDLSGNTEGIYRSTDDAMYLLGVASRKESPSAGQTLLVYEDPVAVYEFPVRVRESEADWDRIQRAEVDQGTFGGATFTGSFTYHVDVHSIGELDLPHLSFEQVHRIDMKVVGTSPAGGGTSRRQVSFLTECFGEVARATSKDGVTEENFDEAAEVRRLGVRR